MSVNFTVFDVATGEILRTGTAMTVAQAQLQGDTPGTRVITEGSDPDTNMVSNPGSDYPGVVTRPTNGAMVADKTGLTANGIDAVTIPNIPAGAIAKVTVPKDMGIDPIQDFAVNDGVLIITTNVIGDYTVLIHAFPNIDYSVTLHAS